jgi:hypothetical protein
MHKRLLPAAITLAVAATLALAACSPGGGGGGELDAERTPFTEYYEALYGDYDEKEQTAKQNEIEELTAACMSREGFEYEPVDQSQYMEMGEEDDVDRDTKEWVASHGYGMSQTPEEQEAAEAEYEDFVDPNADYVASLSESEQTAYYEVLYGPQPTEEELAAGDFEYSWENSGCMGEAQHEINGDDVYEDPKYKKLLDDMNGIWEKIGKDPAMVKADATWSACMADAGFTEFSKQEDALTSINDASNAYYETLGGSEDTMPAEPDPAKLAELREREIEVAVADFDCSEESDYKQTRLRVQTELEQRFIDDHKSELDAMVADVAQNKKK